MVKLQARGKLISGAVLAVSIVGLGVGQALAAHATAMMDISDGLLIDLSRLCAASRCGAEVDLDSLPLSRAFIAERGQDRASRIFAATGGDDYALLAALRPS